MKSKTLTFKLWIYFISFSVSIFVILWFMQVIFLQSYYSSMKKAETESIASQVEVIYEKNDDSKEQIDSLAYKNMSNIYIVDLNGNVEYNSYNMNVLSNKIEIPTRPINLDISEVIKKLLESPNKKFTYTSKIDRFKSEIYIYAKLISNDNKILIIAMSIDPIDSTTSVLKNQLFYVTIISLIIAIFISMFISKRISKPISEMKENALKLSAGDYDVKFKHAGYKEIDELADTLNFTAQELGETDKIRKELIANVAHDLRTPLTMIKAYSEMIRDLSGDNKQKREEHLKIIIDETDRLTRLVNDMMDLSKIESGFATLEKTKFSITDVLISIVDNFKVIYQDDDTSINLELPKDFKKNIKDIYVLADKTKIERVIYNLISNAISHSGKQGCKKIIDVKLTYNSKKVKIEVKDNGVGITKEDIGHIWDRYYRANKNYKRSDTGSGLGLSIVKDILIAHNEKYGVISKEGEGANFFFEIEKAIK